MLSHFQDVNDVADCFEVYSCLDGHLSTIEYQYGHMLYLDQIHELNSLVESMAITEYNMHGGDENKDPKYNKRMIQMQVPQWFTHLKERKTTRATIREQTKDKQIFENVLFSEDMLIRSMRENQKNVIPYISLMKPFIA